MPDVIPFPFTGDWDDISDAELANPSSATDVDAQNQNQDAATQFQVPEFAPVYEDLLNDSTRVRLLAQYYRGRAYYRPDSRSWYLWDDNRQIWLDERNPQYAGRFDMLAQEFLATLSAIADKEGMPLRAGPDSLLSSRCWSALVRLAKHQPEFRMESVEFDANPRYLGVANGILDLQTCTLLTPQPNLHITQRLPIPYDPTATSRIWDRVLVECTGDGPEGHHYRLFLREHFGAMLAGENVRERFTIIHGPGGSGKSTFVNSIKAVLGPYALTTNHDTFSRQRAGAIREDLAAFAGKRLVVDMELPDGHRLDPSVIKMLSGRDQIRARHLYKGGAELHPTWSVVVGCNQLPEFDPPPDSGFWRRVLVLPFLHVPSRPDFELKAKLAHPKTQTAILAWLVAGLKAHHRRINHKRVLNLPKAVQSGCAQYRILVDHLGYWYECCVEPADETLDQPSNAEVWASYRDYCNEYGVPEGRRVNPTHLGRFLSAQGVSRARRHNGRAKAGIRLVDPRRVPLGVFEDEYGYRVNLADFHV